MPFACIFDFDGVIANTVESLYGVYLSFLSAYGKQGNTSEFNRLNGPSLDEIITILKNEYELPLEQQELKNHYKELLQKIYTTAKPNPGVSATLQALHSEGTPILIASACDRKSIEDFLHRHQLAHYFLHIISGDDVAKAKPSPDIYLLARSYVPQHHCMVIEDSENGIRAALSAGLLCTKYQPTASPAPNPFSFNTSDLSTIPTWIKKNSNQSFAIPGSEAAYELTSKEVAFSETDKALTERHWRSESTSKNVFDDMVVCYLSHSFTGQKMTVTYGMVPYRFVFAQLCGVHLSKRLYPIAVSGITTDPANKVLLSIRGQVTQYPGAFECVPCGGLSAASIKGHIDAPKHQLLEELKEEAGIPEEQVASVSFMGLYFNADHGVIDFCYHLKVKEKLDPSSLVLSKESKSLHVENIDQLNQQEAWVPTSQKLIQKVR